MDVGSLGTTLSSYESDDRMTSARRIFHCIRMAYQCCSGVRHESQCLHTPKSNSWTPGVLKVEGRSFSKSPFFYFWIMIPLEFRVWINGLLLWHFSGSSRQNVPVWHVILGEAMEGVNGGKGQIVDSEPPVLAFPFLHFLFAFFWDEDKQTNKNILCPGVFVGCKGVSPTVKWIHVRRRECTQAVCRLRVYYLPGARCIRWELRLRSFQIGNAIQP